MGVIFDVIGKPSAERTTGNASTQSDVSSSYIYATNIL